MPCPLPDADLTALLATLPADFSVFALIATCPRSGGSEAAPACPEVQGGNRAPCGLRVADFAWRFPGQLARSNPGRSPSRWSQHPAVASAAPRASSPRAERSSLYNRLLAHQVRRKEEVAGVPERGSWGGRPRAFLFPESRWAKNLLPEFRADVLDHLERLAIQRHEFAHHVLSSQCFALNLAAPFLRHLTWAWTTPSSGCRSTA
ncbi:MAG: hypothetical protein ABIO70_22695 [Pseudomonadota bacterium]